MSVHDVKILDRWDEDATIVRIVFISTNQNVYQQEMNVIRKEATQK